MIQFLADQLNQLDLALDQLAVSDRNFDRFALMLVDNVVELTLHKYAEDKSYRYHHLRRAARNAPESRAITAALGPYFDAKIKLALSFDLIVQEEAESLKYLHSIRNAAHHTGARHEGILRSVALFYLRCACQLLKKYEPAIWGWYGSDPLPHRAIKYLGKINLFTSHHAFVGAWDRVHDVALHHGDTLIADLHADLLKTIDRTDSQLDFLEANAPSGLTRDDAVVECQLWPFAYSPEGQAFAKEHGGPTPRTPGYVRWIEKNYSWQQTTDPVPSWRRRAASLKNENNPHLALKKYGDFMRQTELLRQLINDGAAELDAELERQADSARGK